MIDLTYTQCKQITGNGHDVRETLELMNNQPSWIAEELTICDIQAVMQGGCASCPWPVFPTLRGI